MAVSRVLRPPARWSELAGQKRTTPMPRVCPSGASQRERRRSSSRSTREVSPPSGSGPGVFRAPLRPQSARSGRPAPHSLRLAGDGSASLPARSLSLSPSFSRSLSPSLSQSRLSLSCSRSGGGRSAGRGAAHGAAASRTRGASSAPRARTKPRLPEPPPPHWPARSPCNAA